MDGAMGTTLTKPAHFHCFRDCGSSLLPRLRPRQSLRNYTSVHARGEEHRLSGHHGLKYEVIQAPDRLQPKRRCSTTKDSRE